jgi:hypothetical protein
MMEDIRRGSGASEPVAEAAVAGETIERFVPGSLTTRLERFPAELNRL